MDPMTQSCHPVGLGTFIGAPSNGEYRFVPLTDPSGRNLIEVELSGVQTLRIVQDTDSPRPDALMQNYFVFIPIPKPATARPILAEFSPADGAVVNARCA